MAAISDAQRAVDELLWDLANTAGEFFTRYGVEEQTAWRFVLTLQLLRSMTSQKHEGDQDRCDPQYSRWPDPDEVHPAIAQFLAFLEGQSE